MTGVVIQSWSVVMASVSPSKLSGAGIDRRVDAGGTIVAIEHNLRVIEVAPGMVQTEEFSLNRLGDKGAADKVYAGVEKPLTADDVADVVRYAVTAPHHVNLDQIIIRPVAQASNFKVIRKG